MKARSSRVIYAKKLKVIKLTVTRDKTQISDPKTYKNIYIRAWVWVYLSSMPHQSGTVEN